MNELPNRIWLQVHGADREDISEAELFAPEVTWCQDKIYDTDVEYARVGPTAPDILKDQRGDG